ncbi:hypothetical protein V8E53_000196 [Lactarius tabidus]
MVYASDCVDCEMVHDNGRQGICIIDFDAGKVVYGQLVKPTRAISANRGLSGYNSEAVAHRCLDTLKFKTKHRPRYGEFRTDYEPIRISHVRTPESCMAAFDQATALATTLVCENEAGIFDVLFTALDYHEFVFGGLVDGRGARRTTSSAQKPENPNLAGATEKKTENSVAPPTPDSNGSTSLPLRTSPLRFSGHSDARSMFTLAARRTECSEERGGKRASRARNGTTRACAWCNPTGVPS